MSETKSYEDVLEDNREQIKDKVDDIPVIKFDVSPNYKGKNPKSPEELAKMYEERKAKRETKKSTKRYESTDPAVNPNHYKSKNGIEVIDVIEAFTDGLDGVESYDVGNILKYITRYKKKNGLQDCRKAAWYLNHLIQYLEGQE